MTEAKLNELLREALQRGDYAAVRSLSKQIMDIQKAEQDRVTETEEQRIAEVERLVTAALVHAVESLIEQGKLDTAEGIYFNWTFGDDPPHASTRRKQPKQNQRVVRFPEMKTVELVRDYGDVPFPGGGTYREAYHANSDSNFRFVHIRKPLLKLAGLS